MVTAQSAIEAEAAIGRGAFDICILDLNLGEVYGLDLLPRLREWKWASPVSRVRSSAS